MFLCLPVKVDHYVPAKDCIKGALNRVSFIHKIDATEVDHIIKVRFHPEFS